MPSAYFEVSCAPDGSVFVIRLDDEGKIAHARAIISGEEEEAVHVSGTVVSEAVDYNPQWPFHLEPKSCIRH